LNAEGTRKAVRRIRELTDKPFGAGATLLMPGAKENAEVLLEEKVPVINFSLGKGDWIIKRAHEYGGKVIATVVTERHALAAEKQGADALQVTGHEAAAHGGAVTSLVLVPAIANAVKIPIIATGGFADGRGLAAALALGADAISMGTRFSLTKESPVHENTKRATLEMGIQDTLYSNRFDGLYCRVMNTPSAKKAIKRGMSLPRAAIVSMSMAKELHLNWFMLALGTILRGPKIMLQLAHFASAVEKIKAATEDGDLKEGVHLIGQVQGLINDMPTVAEVMKRTIEEARAIQKNMAAALK
jgi:enoyl-[acyl-carrier protein] reductase II